MTSQFGHSTIDHASSLPFSECPICHPELQSVMEDIERSSPLNRLRGEIEKAIAELPTVHPQGTRENHCDLIHADRLRLILEGSK